MPFFMLELPEKIIPASRRRIWLTLACLWLLMFPCICFLLYLTHDKFSQGESISNNVIISIVLVGVLLSLTFLVKTQSSQLVTLTSEGIKIVRNKESKFFAWSDISHIDENVIHASGSVTRILSLHLNKHPSKEEVFQGKNKRRKFWNDKSMVNIPTRNFRMSHIEVIDLVDTYFLNSKTS